MLYLFKYISHKLFVVSLLDVLWSINTINLFLFSNVTIFVLEIPLMNILTNVSLIESVVFIIQKHRNCQVKLNFFSLYSFQNFNLHNNIFNQNHIYISLILICTLTQGGHWLSSDTRLLVNNTSIFKTNLSKGTMFTKLLCM